MAWEDKYVWNPNRYIAEGLLPAFDTSKSHGPNRSILILANAAMSMFNNSLRRSAFKSHLLLLDWVYDIRRKSGFHAGGPVRMLLWCPQKDTTAILPRTILYRSKLSLALETTCHVEEIIGSDETARGKQRKRDQNVELMSEKRVAEHMHKSGIAVPAGRETELYRQVQEGKMHAGEDDAGEIAPNSSVRTRGWHKELQDLQQRFEANEFAKAEGMLRVDKSKTPKRATLTPPYARLVELERNIKHIRKRTNATEQLLQEQAEIDALDTQAFKLPQNDPQQHTLLQKIQERKEKLQDCVDNTTSPNVRKEFVYFKHDRKAFSQNPPLLMWDQRRANSLKAYDDEFYPPNGLCLLDIEPKHPLPFPQVAGEGDSFAMLLTALWQNRNDNLIALDQIAPGAFDALTPMVPALTDPGRGGERDIRDLPINRLTPEMMYGLTKAWIDWPFRPDLIDLLRKGKFDEDVDVLDTQRRGRL